MGIDKVKAKASTSWGVVSGCIHHILTCDSSDSDSFSDEIGVLQQPSLPFLVLRRPHSHSDSIPCQITIDFGQPHEIKQVYVRSSARVYEIYYDVDNHYLCTVRCGPLHSSTSPTHHHSLPTHIHNFQYMFEATAEVADAEPVLSITLRLLSIQSGDYVRIDEVYVFSDPVVSADIDSTENSSGNSLMSMLIPTLMQLSKSRMSQNEQHNDSEAENKSNSAAGALHSTMVNGSCIDMSKPHVPLQKSAVSGGGDTVSSHMETSLDELVSRVANIEELCLKFEEKLVKPISNMEARLVKIEQQLESFVGPQKCRTCCTEIVAPESESVSNDGMESRLSKKWEEASMSPSDTCFVKSSYACLPSNVPHLLPSLVVTAPDFANIDDDDDEGNESGETVKLSWNECAKKPPSLDDALASALAGFLSSSLEASFKPADCTCEEEEEEEETNITPLPDSITSDDPSIHVNQEETKTESYCIYMNSDYDLDNNNQADSSSDINLDLDSPAPVAGGPSENDSTNTCKLLTDDALHDILNLPTPPLLDFTTCILDVEFSSHQDSFANPPLQDLLTDMSLFQDEEAPSVKDTAETSFTHQNDLIFIGSEISDKTDEIWLPDPHFCCISSNTQDKVQDFHDSSHASLI